MTRKRLLAQEIAFFIIALGACSRPWPVDEIERVKELLSKGPRGFDCYQSTWMQENGVSSYSYFSDSDSCRKNIKIKYVIYDNNRVIGVARCKISLIGAEYKITVFKSDKINSSYGGYLCTSAHGENLSRFPVGSITDDGVI